MACEHVTVDGVHAIVCGPRRRAKPCSGCGGTTVALCDWRVGTTPGGKRRDCDAPLCERCRTRVGPQKDLCRAHAEHWAERLAWELCGGHKNPGTLRPAQASTAEQEAR